MGGGQGENARGERVQSGNRDDASTKGARYDCVGSRGGNEGSRTWRLVRGCSFAGTANLHTVEDYLARSDATFSGPRLPFSRLRIGRAGRVGEGGRGGGRVGNVRHRAQRVAEQQQQGFSVLIVYPALLRRGAKGPWNFIAPWYPLCARGCLGEHYACVALYVKFVRPLLFASPHCVSRLPSKSSLTALHAYDSCPRPCSALPTRPPTPRPSRPPLSPRSCHSAPPPEYPPSLPRRRPCVTSTGRAWRPSCTATPLAGTARRAA